MTYKRGFILVLVLTAACGFGLTWMAIHPTSIRHLNQSRVLLFMLLIFAVIPIYPLYRRFKGMHSFRYPLLIVAILTTTASVVAEYVLPSDAGLSDALFKIGTLLIVTTCVVFIWNGLVKRRPGSQ